MRLEAKKYLYDIQQGITNYRLTSGKRLDGYRADAMLRSAVERQFEIIGEALTQLAKLDEALVAHVSEYRRIIAFRNILIHGYAEVDDRLVWDIVETKLPILRQQTEALLKL
ncbi:MAG TPA: HepT-like ribonuclease domain-containing protein [Candidatus Acidoferrales bacterium]